MVNAYPLPNTVIALRRAYSQDREQMPARVQLYLLPPAPLFNPQAISLNFGVDWWSGRTTLTKTAGKTTPN